MDFERLKIRSLWSRNSWNGRNQKESQIFGCAMKTTVLIAVVALAACSNVLHAQTTPAAPAAEGQSAPVAEAAPAGDGLNDLDAMTFGCPKAALNAAAREAAKVSSQGTYQFAYFEIINDSHHSAYEIHFKSNYAGEADLKYCVSMYCQQGWDPKTTKTSVMLINNKSEPAGVAAHGSECVKLAPTKRRLKQ